MIYLRSRLQLHPFVAFCLYIAARVLIHTYVKRRDAVDVREKFEFLLGAMQTHMEKTPITASFLMQLQLELEAAGIEDPLAKVPMKVSYPASILLYPDYTSY